MKKIYSIYLIGFLLIAYYIFNNSVYEIYGLNNIGDTSLNKYQICDSQSDSLLKVYNELIDRNSEFQIIKNPVTDNNDIYYDIYHTDINSVKKIVGVSHNIYRYYELKEDDFIDSNGLFGTNLKSSDISDISNKIGIDIKAVYESSISYKEIVKQNILQFIILIICTIAVIYIYTYYLDIK